MTKKVDEYISVAHCDLLYVYCVIENLEGENLGKFSELQVIYQNFCPKFSFLKVDVTSYLVHS